VAHEVGHRSVPRVVLHLAHLDLDGLADAIGLDEADDEREEKRRTGDSLHCLVAAFAVRSFSVVSRYISSELSSPYNLKSLALLHLILRARRGLLLSLSLSCVSLRSRFFSALAPPEEELAI
jgi:hypothetical protein